MPAQKGDRLYIPPRSYNAPVVSVKWTDWFKEFSANYVVVTAKNQSQNGEDVQLFMAEEWYNDNQLRSIGAQAFPSPGGWSVLIDSRFQYGERNRNGDNRFVVYHDKDNRSPYQHMFAASAQRVMLDRMNNVVQTVLPGFLEGAADFGADTLRTQFGDPLRTF